MHKYFADWYSIAKPDPSADTLERRWTGIESFSQQIEMRRAFELVRLFFGRNVLDGKSEERFRQAFKDADAAFLMRDNSVELQVLAGSALVNILNQAPSHTTDATALAILCFSCRGLRSPTLMSDVLTYAENYVETESSRVREVEAVSNGSSDNVVSNKEIELLNSAIEEATLQTNPEILLKLIKKVSNSSSVAEKAIKALKKNLEIQQEETNILWWLFSEHSRDRQEYVGDIGLPELSLLVGKELADLTILQPGARRAQAFMSRMLRTAKTGPPGTTTIAEAVETASREWRHAWMNSSDPGAIGDICPAHLAVSNSLPAEGAELWVTAFENRTGLKASDPIDVLELATQTYQETLLIRLSKN